MLMLQGYAVLHNADVAGHADKMNADDVGHADKMNADDAGHGVMCHQWARSGPGHTLRTEPCC